MSGWMLAVSMIEAEAVPEKHYFLESLHTPVILWGIRGLCVLMFVAAIVIYIKMKDKKGE